MKNSKILKSVVSLFIVLGLLITFVSCTKTVKYKVSFVSGEKVIATVEVEKDKTLTAEQVPTASTIDGYEFVGWFDGETEFKLENKITKNVTYTAKYEKIPTYTVTFIADEKEVAKHEVEKGKTLSAEQVPSGPVKAGHEFVGWFNGETEFKVETKITENVTYTAKYEPIPTHTITFKVGEEVVKEVVVEEGKKIDVVAVPGDPSQKAHAFVGWFNGTEEFNEEAVITASATYTAKFERSHYIVTFGETEVLVAVGTPLSLQEVENPTQAGAYFSGWFAGTTMATEGMAVESDMAFVAKFVTSESFNGTWSSENGAWYTIENGKVISGDFGERGQIFTFSTETGKLTYSEDSFYANNHSFTVTSEGLTYANDYYDAMEEAMVSVTETLTKKEATGYEGTYRADNSSIIEVIDGGVITKFNGSTTTKGIIKETTDGLVIIYATPASQEKIVSASFDEKNSLVMDDKVYVKNSDGFSYLYLSESPTIYIFTVSEETIVVVSENQTSHYGTIDGTVAIGEIITVNYNEKSMIIKVTGDISYVAAGSEKGSYNEGDNVLVLDGFGNATYNGSEATYTVNALGIVIIDGAGYQINKEDSTHISMAKDSVNTGKYIYNDSQNYSLVFDGFGGATLTYKSSYSDSKTYYHGSYVLSDTTITISDVNGYYADGTWTIEEDGKVLAKDGKIYLLEGATFVDVREELNGVYGETGQITITTGKVIVDGTEYTLTYNYNGSKASYEVEHKDPTPAGTEVTFTDVITLSLTAEGKLLVYTAHESFDEYFEGTEITYTSVEHAPYVPAELDAYTGTWTGVNGAGVSVTFVFNGDGTGTSNGSAMAYIISGEEVTFDQDGQLYYTLTGDPTTGTLTVSWGDGYDTYGTFEVTKEVEEPNLDAFAGTWVGTNAAGSTFTFVFNGDGTGTADGSAIEYVISNGTLTFTHNYQYDYTFSGDPATGTLTVNWSDVDYGDLPSYTVTKQA